MIRKIDILVAGLILSLVCSLLFNVFVWNQINALNTDKNNLQLQLNSLNTTYQNYVSTHSHNDSEYDTLNMVYQNFRAIIDKGEAIAKSASATWVSEDKLLNVTSELIPEVSVNNILWSYTVIVNVTNISNQPLDYFFIFLLPYADGKLLCYRFGPFLYATIRLNMGEVFSWNFTDVPKEMTIYKVFVAAGYY